MGTVDPIPSRHGAVYQLSTTPFAICAAFDVILSAFAKDPLFWIQVCSRFARMALSEVLTR